MGEILIRDGLITVAQLEQGLRSQVIHGGRLGTNLIELFDLDLDAIAIALAAQHQLPPALKDHFNRCNRELQQQLPAELAGRLGAVPIGYLSSHPDHPRRVAVAVIDPLAPMRVAQLTEALGCEAVLCVASELRMHYQLEYVYNIPRPNRFKRARRSTQPPPDVLASMPEEERQGRARRRFVQTLSDLDAIEEDQPALDRGAEADDDIPIDEEDPHERSRRHLARIAIKRVSRPPVVGEQPHEASVDSFDDAITSIRRATGRDRVADLAIGALEHAFTGRFDAAVFFVIRSGLAIAWKGFVRDGEPPAFDQIAVPLHEESALAVPVSTGELFVGPPMSGGSELDERLWAALAQPIPAEVIVAPIVLYDQVVCLLYAQARAGALDPECCEQLATLGNRVTAAFKRLIEAAQR